jgi:Lysophospholipase L1 and related esterases
MNRSLFKKIFAALLTVCIIASSCVVVFAADIKKTDKAAVKKERFVVIGDSIATGYLLEDLDYSYASLMAKALDLEEVNLAVNGYDSKDVLNLLRTGKAKKAIMDASLISLSVGGNNILKYVIKQIEAMDDVAVEDMAELFSPDLMKQFTAGAESFKTEFPEIIAKIKKLNPDAVIVVQTVYNPFMFIKTGMKLEPATICDIVISRINKVIKAYLTENPDAFILSDVHAAFKAKAEPSYLNADFETFNFDPHPALDGHALIAETNLAALAGEPVETADAAKTDKDDKAVILPTTDEMLESISKKAAEKFKEIVNADKNKKP